MSKKTIQNINIIKSALSIALVVVLVAVTADVLVQKVFAQTLPINLHQTIGTGVVSPQQTQGLQQVACVGTSSTQVVFGDLHGWLWSDMPTSSDQVATPTNQQAGRGFGWISTNGSDSGVSGNYKVTIGATGALSGDAWSQNGGWLDFAPSGPYPTYTISMIPLGGGPAINRNVLPTTPATIDPTCLAAQRSGCAVTGWARFVAGEAATNTGGWDGWVNLSGSIYNRSMVIGSFGVTFDADPNSGTYGSFSGKAWGGTDSGWISFDQVTTSPATQTLCQTPTDLTCNGVGTYAGQTFTYPVAGPVPSQCGSLSLSCPGVGAYATLPVTMYAYPASGPVPSECTNGIGNPSTLTCSGVGTYAGQTFAYPSGGTTPPECISTDECSNLPGTQTGAGPWQAPNGNWYGLLGGICSQSVCTNLTNTYYATPPANYTVSTDQSGNSICTPNGTGTGVTTGVPIKPVYKEN